MRRRWVRLGIGLGIGLGSGLGIDPAGAQASDTTTQREPVLTRGDAWLAAGFAAGIVVFWPHDEKIALWSQSPAGQGSLSSGVVSFGNWWGSPGVLLVSAGTYGVARIAGSRAFSEVGLRATEAIILSGAITGLIKGVAGRQRPYVDINDPYDFAFGRGFTDGAYTSFPSGHTTAAFAFAASVTDETAHLWPKHTWWVATITYGSAIVTGAARIYSNKHWSTDVVAGAMVGTFSGLVVTRWHRAHPNSKLDQWLLPKAVAPSKGGISLTWAASF